jgi:phage-related holin
MIKARMGNLVLIGLNRVNIDRLLTNQPILVKGDEIGITQDIIIIANETLDQVIDDMRSLGIPIPE